MNLALILLAILLLAYSCAIFAAIAIADMACRKFYTNSSEIGFTAAIKEFPFWKLCSKLGLLTILIVAILKIAYVDIPNLI